jgi:predicted transcriptional regulator
MNYGINTYDVKENRGYWCEYFSSDKFGLNLNKFVPYRWTNDYMTDEEKNNEYNIFAQKNEEGYFVLTDLGKQYIKDLEYLENYLHA